MVLGYELSLIDLNTCRLMTTKKRCNNYWIVKLNTLWYIVFNHFFLKLFFFNLLTFFLGYIEYLVEGEIQ
jgi:hypothetical protein